MPDAPAAGDRKKSGLALTELPLLLQPLEHLLRVGTVLPFTLGHLD
jgi:hypothetical protein